MADGSSQSFSTLKSINQVQMNPLSMPLVRVHSDDFDSNNKVDFYGIQIQLKTDPSLIRKVEVLGTFEYYVSDKLRMRQIGMINLSVDCPNGASKIVTNGKIVLN
mmetsp:Transcript_11445/g.19354  ORF Transcript_11445/g.19354 Transcript_11445/m.19354 type:complete len:105 (+) Transcript_11445:213-527(+)